MAVSPLAVMKTAPPIVAGYDMLSDKIWICQCHVL